MFVVQVLGDDRESPIEDKGEEAADGTGIVCADSSGKMGCAT